MNRLLLDTHAFLWWVEGNDRLPKTLLSMFRDDGVELFLSAASAWEISTKVRIGKLVAPGDLRPYLQRAGIQALAVAYEDGWLAGRLASEHKDPFDRMIAAQALRHGLSIVSSDTALDDFGVKRLWN